MNYLFAPDFVDDREIIFQSMKKALGTKNRLAMFHTIEALAVRLEQFDNPEIVVLLAVKKEQMAQIMAISDFLEDAAIIILLSDDEEETVTSALRLKPKYIGNMNNDTDKIMPIVKKLMRTNAARKQKENTHNDK